MDLRNLTYPDGYSKPSDPLVDRYERLIWKSSEVCNNCFQQIRAVGELVEKNKGTWRFSYNRFYERTEHGSQEYDPYALPSDRYGQCYCLDCGSDTRATNDDIDTDTLVDRAKNIAGYIARQTDADVDARAMGKALHALKAEPANQGYDSEILAAATCVGLARAETDAGTPKATA